MGVHQKIRRTKYCRESGMSKNFIERGHGGWVFENSEEKNNRIFCGGHGKGINGDWKRWVLVEYYQTGKESQEKFIVQKKELNLS